MEKENKSIVMLGTSYETMGGVSSVVNTYRRAGLFDRWPIIYLTTHRDGNGFTKVMSAITSFTSFLWLLAIGKIGCIHAHTASRASFWRKSIFIIIARIAKIPVIFHLHGAEFDTFYYRECNNILKKYIRYVLKNSSTIIVLSSQWKKIITEITGMHNIKVIFNPVDTASCCSQADSARDPLTLLFLGRLGERKGIYDLIKVTADLHKQYPEIRLLCGGDGHIDQVMAYAKDLGIKDCVEVLGWVQGEEKKRLLLTSTIFILPSYAEGLPMSILEAMAYGMPVISTSVGGIPDAINHEVDGIMVQPGDTEELRKSIEKLLKNPVMRHRIGSAARNKVNKIFNANKILPELEKIYTEIGICPIGSIR
jgi:glycosyltransferase involved in cell wall biosynthesis